MAIDFETFLRDLIESGKTVKFKPFLLDEQPYFTLEQVDKPKVTFKVLNQDAEFVSAEG